MSSKPGKQEPTSAWDRAEARLRALGVSPENLDERFVLGSGKGGQKVNRTASAVQLREARSGTEVKCNSERSQYLNRLKARERLADLLESQRNERRQAAAAARARRRFEHRKPSAASKRKRVEGKRSAGLRKQLRKKPGFED